MDYDVMKKKLDTYRKSNGQFKRVHGDLLIELLRMWESWTGAPSEFAKKLGMRSKQLGSLVREGRKIATSTENIEGVFHPLEIPGVSEPTAPCHGIEVVWDGGKIIRFPTVDTLMDFIKKAS